ncbi:MULTISPECIES: PD-(D/E)XK nuclease family protein [Salinibacter]|jgi:hypothetical protein|uniref:PD-(D/E)XK endonuclease-like domain-containing protein n=1 Tax=Salinibacter ruber TaxID=146919 RepID=A0A9X2U4T3_9BACT|nr:MULTISPECIES: PD-(D/E)XK nuclease family protein [Salinibacter]MCS3856414.1 hypothetical protein [Salinibacter ruber]MCS3859873.1 hypothetical protein [Salinibacter ruber]MCS3866683.1 hypothetical protein [Salinibacter ruber]
MEATSKSEPGSDPPEIPSFLREAFEENYERLRLSTNQSLSPAARESAFTQVLLYWQKLRDIAERITETEVRLALPAQETPKGRSFVIEGVVDIVQESGHTVMYDIKTHDAGFVRENQELYSDQLSVYAYIWEELRGEPLDETAVIATAIPSSLQQALNSGDEDHVSYELQKWNPLVEIDFDKGKVEETIRDFAETIDQIEDGEFDPPSAERLSERQPGQDALFATRVCNNCDARYSCPAYRMYITGSRKEEQINFRSYFMEAGSEVDRDARLDAGLQDTPSGDELGTL